MPVIPTVADVPRSCIETLGVETEHRDPLPDVREDLQAEFAAIMKFSGFGDRIVVSTLRPPELERFPCRQETVQTYRAAGPVIAICLHPHERSPPD